MGIFWDLIQQSEIQEQGEKANDLEAKVLILEKELNDTKILLRKTLLILEKHLGKDIDGDGKLG
mgnify:FL=1|jgi:hypothetical protein